MCGILGAFRSEIEGEQFQNALNELKDRGPDDEGYHCLDTWKKFYGDDSSVTDGKHIEGQKSGKWFGNRRLSVTGGKECRQPMSLEDISIVYEGEIYNYRDLRGKLEELGHSFETEGDTEIFLHAFEEWGLNAVERMEGKWCAGIYERSKDRLLCLRDHFGTKPLYYVKEDGDFLFSSKIKPLLQLKKSDTGINQDIKTDYLKYKLLDHKEHTFFQNVKQLRPGEYLEYREGELEKNELPRSTIIPDEDIGKTCKEALKSKIPESKWCISLSGGLDSSILAAFMSNENKNPESYSVNVEKGQYESSTFREDVLQDTGLSNKEIDITVEKLIQDVEKSVEIQEEPTNTIIAQAQRVLFEEIGKSDHKVVLTGSGADELFYGYDIFRPLAVADAFKREGLLSGLTMLKEHLNNMSRGQIKYLLSMMIPFIQRDTSLPPISNSIDYVTEPESYEKSQLYPAEPDLSKARRRQIKYFWYPSITRFTDKNAGRYGLEVRESFLSQKLLNKLESKEPLDNLRGGDKKKVLKEVFKEILPNSVVQREKIGFMPTDNSLYTTKVKEKFLEVFKSESFSDRKDINQEKVIKDLEEGQLEFSTAYRLYCFEIWARRYID